MNSSEEMDQEDKFNPDNDQSDHEDSIDDTESSGSSDSDEDSAEEKADVQVATMLDPTEYASQLAVLEQTISESPYQYQSYIDLIKLAKDNLDFPKLREYRQQMSDMFPLTEKLWLDWLKDEQKLMTSEEDRSKVRALFEKALGDYLSVEVWLEYIQFSISDMGKPNGLELIRSVCERSLELAGLDVSKGYSLWEAYREFECAVLSGLQASSAGSIQTEAQKNQTNEQIQRIVSLFKRQLGTCLDNTKQTYLELEQFDDTYMDSDVEAVYKQTLLKYQEVLPFEMALKTQVADEPKKLAEFKNYLDYELKGLRHKSGLSVKQSNGKGNNHFDNDQDVDQEEMSYLRLRIKCLFERALADNSNCLDDSLWLKYIYFLNEEDVACSTSASNEFYLKVSQRSIRNCPWSAKLWINYAFNLEKSAFLNTKTAAAAEVAKNPVDTIKAVFNQALNSGLQTSNDYLLVWHAYLDFLKRGLGSASSVITEDKADEIRTAFQKAIDQLFEFFKLTGDPTYSLEKYWALVEAKCFKNMEKSRKIYNEMILAKIPNAARYAQIWLEFFELEKEFGDQKHQRKLLNRALNEVNMDQKELIYEAFLNWEKLYGNIQQHANIYFRYEQFKEVSQLIASRKRAKTEQKEKSQPKTPAVVVAKSEGARKPVEKSNSLKRKKSESSEDGENKPQQKKQLAKDKDGFAIPSLPFTAKPVVPDSKQNQPDQQQQQAVIQPKGPKSTEHYKKFSDQTVFISNLAYDVDEAKLQAIFDKIPGYQEIRLIRGWNGKTKGYGYVDFDNAESATCALKLDRSLVDTRPLFVSKNKDKTEEIPGMESKLKYATALEKNKLFVSGLPFSTSKSDLEKIMERFGTLKEVRIVVYKNGKSKGLAYVEFDDEQSAKNALLQTDGMLIGENQIAVAISNPPKRNNPSDSSSGSSSNEKARSLGSGSYKTAANTQGPASTSNGPSSASTLSFVPRAQALGQRKKTLNFK